jgi:hypothetical protein
MRKMLFSAIALVAFTASSMAGEKPKEEVKTVNPACSFEVTNALICLHDTEGFWDWVFTYFTIYSNCVESQKNSKN